LNSYVQAGGVVRLRNLEREYLVASKKYEKSDKQNTGYYSGETPNTD
jgi:hypothetical protein